MKQMAMRAPYANMSDSAAYMRALERLNHQRGEEPLFSVVDVGHVPRSVPAIVADVTASSTGLLAHSAGSRFHAFLPCLVAAPFPSPLQRRSSSRSALAPLLWCRKGSINTRRRPPQRR